MRRASSGKPAERCSGTTQFRANDNTAPPVQTSRAKTPILVVAHDADDDGWQFLDGRDVDTEEARLIAMRRVLHLDPSLREVADLPPGWMARRHRVGGAWWRGPNPRADGQ